MTDVEANELVMAYRPLALRMAGEFTWLAGPLGIGEDDIRSEVMLAMVKASRSYRPDLGTFSSWAAWWIRGSMAGLRKKSMRASIKPKSLTRRDGSSRQIVAGGMLPNDAVEISEQVDRVSRRLSERELFVMSERSGGRKRTEVAAEIGISPQRVLQIEQGVTRRMSA